MSERGYMFGILFIFGVFSGANAVCYPAPSYKATDGKYTCRLSQANWASETYFEIEYKHCLTEPTISVFIRNFYGIDEINMDFSKLKSSWKTMSFSGKLSMIAFKFSTFQPNPKYATLKQVQIQVYFFAVFGNPEGEHLLTAVFPAHDKSDCSWVSTLALHDQIFFGGGLCLAVLLVIFVIYFYRKCRNKPTTRRYQAAKVQL